MNPRAEDSAKAVVLYMALELSNTKWKVAFGDGSKVREVNVGARDLKALDEQIAKAKKRFGLKDDSPVVSCYEAGRDGFWLHRHLVQRGVQNVVVDSSSIEVPRRFRRAKTDRLDAKKLLTMLIRYCMGEQGVWSVVRVPEPEEEDGRRTHRELDVLTKERTAHRNRIRGLLVLEGIEVGNPGRKDLGIWLERQRSRDGRPLGMGLKGQLMREQERLRQVEVQIAALEKEQDERLKRAEDPTVEQMLVLMTLCGLGCKSGWVLVKEFFAWRSFRNGKEVGAASGMAPTPYSSGGSQREQGIGKSGNRRIRTLMIQLAWRWLRFQPNSKLSLWFEERFAHGGRRMRRIGIVAVARKLLIALWRYLDEGIVPEGARLKSVA
jgi:transposase